MKVSFDFDGTLTIESILNYAESLIKRGFEVWIVTSRMGFGKEPKPDWNDDLFEIANYIGIKKEHIHFCCMDDKANFFKDKDFIFHIDDDNIELSLIRAYTKVEPIYVFANRNWKEDCEKAIKEYKL